MLLLLSSYKFGPSVLETAGLRAPARYIRELSVLSAFFYLMLLLDSIQLWFVLGALTHLDPELLRSIMFYNYIP
jgi:hypothetical protein